MKEGDKIEVFDEKHKQWFKGKLLWIVRLDKKGKPDAWGVELSNGNRGEFDLDRIRRPHGN